MATLESTITITHEVRPCYVNDKKALFHRWIDKEQCMLQFNAFVMPNEQRECVEEYRKRGWLPPHAKIEKFTMTFAIVEYEDGTVAEVEPTKIRFADRKINEYAFDKEV